MSYSFSFRAASKAEAIAQAAIEFDRQVLAGQPIHARDREAALANASAMINLLDDEPNDDQVVAVSMHGSVGWRWPIDGGPGSERLNSANASCTAHLAPKT